MHDRTESAPDPRVVDWLLEPDQPSVRYYTLTELLGRRADDPEVRAARAAIPRTGWAADLLGALGPKGVWEAHDPRNVKEWVDYLMFPIYRSTNWKALLLSDLGLTSADRRVRAIAENIFGYKLRLGSVANQYHEEVCIAGNTARLLTRFGYGEDPRVARLYRWLVEDQREDGGWNCSQGTPGTLDAWEALAAFSVLPPAKRSAAMGRAVERGAEFYLRRGLMREGRAYPPWSRLHYPNHYFYDYLVGLDVLTRLGFAGDRRLRPALRWLASKRRAEGTWAPDRVHPDVPPGVNLGVERTKVRPLALEPAGRPSKWITLTALRVGQRVADAS